MSQSAGEGQSGGQGSKEESIGLEELDTMEREGETIVPGGNGGGRVDAQEHLAEGCRKEGLSTTTVLEEEKAKQEGIAVNPLDPKDCKTCKE